MYDTLLNFDNLSWWIIDIEDDPNVFYCNKTMCNTFSLDESLIKHSVKETCPIAGDYNKNIMKMNSDKAKQIFDEYHLLKNGGIKEYNNTFPYFDLNLEKTIYFTSRATTLKKDSEGNAAVLFGIIEPEITSNELYKKVITDSLTGLYNRREFDLKLELFINIAFRKKQHLSLILCDIDYFKQYNDNLGHYAGDKCLVQVAQSIASVCHRYTDIVCRYGGEEFAVIVYGNETEANHIAETMRQAVYLENLPHPTMNNTPVTISLGYYSAIPNPDSTAKHFIECTDQALYRAKKSGRNTIVSYDSF